jgi:hypothetical protein
MTTLVKVLSLVPFAAALFTPASTMPQTSSADAMALDASHAKVETRCPPFQRQCGLGCCPVQSDGGGVSRAVK